MEELILIFLEEQLIRAFLVKSNRASFDLICKKYKNNTYKKICINLKDKERIDKTTFKLWDYLEEE